MASGFRGYLQRDEAYIGGLENCIAVKNWFQIRILLQKTQHVNEKRQVAIRIKDIQSHNVWILFINDDGQVKQTLKTVLQVGDPGFGSYRASGMNL